MTPDQARRSYQEIVDFMLADLADSGVITDMAPGGVARTMVEATAREFAEFYARMHAVYQAGFIDTATGASLDQLVALVGLSRIDGEAAVGELRLLRDKRISARVVVPMGTQVAITRVQPETRVIYEIVDDYELPAGEASLVVSIRSLPGSETGQTLTEVALTADDVAQSPVTLLRPIAGIAAQELVGPSVPLTTRETDEALRKRAKLAIAAAGGGTATALSNALMAIPPIKAVELRDAASDPVPGVDPIPPGELEVVLDAPAAELTRYRDAIAAAIETHKGPGILARVRGTGTKVLSGEIRLVPASDGLTGAQSLKLVADAQAVLAAEVSALDIGGTLVWNRILAGLMGVENLADVNLPASWLSFDGTKAAPADIVVPLGHRLELGVGVDAVGMVIQAGPALEVAVTVEAAIAAPDASDEANQKDLVTEILTAWVDAINARAPGSPPAIDPASLIAQLTGPGGVTGDLGAAITATSLSLHVTDVAESATVTLTGAGATPITEPADAYLRLADPPVTLTFTGGGL